MCECILKDCFANWLLAYEREFVFMLHSTARLRNSRARLMMISSFETAKNIWAVRSTLAFVITTTTTTVD